MYYQLFFSSEEQARTFISEVNNLGYEWHPLHLCYEKPSYGPSGYSWILKYEADARTVQKIVAYYMGS